MAEALPGVDVAHMYLNGGQGHGGDGVVQGYGGVGVPAGIEYDAVQPVKICSVFKIFLSGIVFSIILSNGSFVVKKLRIGLLYHMI